MKVNDRLIYCLSLCLFVSYSSVNAESTNEMDEKVREAVVAELTRVQQEQLDNSLKQVEQRQVETAADKQNQLQQMLKLTVAKAVIDNTPAKPAKKEPSPETQSTPQTKTISRQENKPQEPQAIETQAQKEIEKEPVQATQQATQQATNKSVEKAVSKQSASTSEKWIYLGQYKAGSWEEKTLNIENGTLPNTGRSYTLNQSVNVRNGLPAKKQMPRVIKALASNDKVDLIELKKSGKNGHYWGKVSY